MKNELMLSVVVFSYNHKDYIDTCLESIFRQKTDFLYEVLIADDASPDGTARMVKERYGDKIKVLNRENNLGLCANMYDAFMQAKGKYIYDCSGDDYLPNENVFQDLADYLENHEDIFSVSGWTETYNVAKEFKVIGKPAYSEYTMLDFLRGVKVNFYTGMMRNTFKQDKPKYFCDASRNNEEVQIWYYTLTKGKKAILPKCVYTYCYRNDVSFASYNSSHTFLDMLEDYAKGFQTVEHIAQKRYNFALAKMTYYSGCIDYHIQNNGLKSAPDIAKVLGFKDTLSFVWIKLLMRLNHRKIPQFLLREKRLIRRE